MRLLLDTHTLIWAAIDPGRLSNKARDAIEDVANDVFVSAISGIEIATKVRIRKLNIGRALATCFVEQVEARGFVCLDITAGHGEYAGNLRVAHNDPWDRLLIAQARMERLLLVTCDIEVGRVCKETYW